MAIYDYGYNYGFDPDAGAAAAAGLTGFFGVFMILYYLLTFGLSIAVYVIQAISLHSIATRRGIHHPWLAWIPVGNMWLLGSISDQYQYIAKGQVRNRRKVLLGVMIAIFALFLLMFLSMVPALIAEAGAGDASEVLFGAGIAVMMLAALAMFILAVVGAVFQYIALYDLFASCEPSNATLYLVISILFSITLPVFMLICRKKDLGMPPRVVPTPAYIPEPYAEPACGEQTVPVTEAAPMEEVTPVEEAPIEEAAPVEAEPSQEEDPQ